jgi:type II secretory pathway pseudopilin PulG
MVDSLAMKILVILSIVLAGILPSCIPMSPEQRIEKNPSAFLALPLKQQQQVRQGQISRGMSPQAVLLAWGAPSRRYEGMNDGVATQRWDYFGSQPVFTNQWAYGSGWGRSRLWGACGAWGPNQWGDPFLGTDIAYIPYRRATIVFKDEKVDSWEKMQDTIP